MHISYATLKLASVYASAVLCGWGAGTLTVCAILLGLYLRGWKHDTVVKPILRVLIAILLAFVVSALFALSFIEIMSADRDSISLAATYFSSMLAAFVVAGIFWKRVDAALLLRLKRAYAELDRNP